MKSIASNKFILKKSKNKLLLHRPSFIISNCITSGIEPIDHKNYIRTTSTPCIMDKDDWYWLEWDINEYLSDLREELYTINSNLFKELYNIKYEVFGEYTATHHENLKYIENSDPMTVFKLGQASYFKILWYDECCLVNCETGIVAAHYSKIVPRCYKLEHDIITSSQEVPKSMIKTLVDVIMRRLNIGFNKLLKFKLNKK